MTSRRAAGLVLVIGAVTGLVPLVTRGSFDWARPGEEVASLVFLAGFGMLPFLPLAGLAAARILNPDAAVAFAAVIAVIDTLIVVMGLSAPSAQAGMIAIAEPIVAFLVVGVLSVLALIVRAITARTAGCDRPDGDAPAS